MDDITLERAELFTGVDAGAPKLKHLSRPEKIFLGDTNLMDALVPQPNAGAVRETFFVNQLRAAGHSILVPAKGDFIVDESSLFKSVARARVWDRSRTSPIPMW